MKNIKSYRVEFFSLFVVFVISRLVMAVMVLIYNAVMGTDHSFAFLMNQWDAKRYQFIIEHGYTFPLDTDPQANWAFFPLYVIVCQFVKLLTFWKLDTFWVGMIVSNICIFIAAFFGIKYIKNMKGVFSSQHTGLENTVVWGLLIFAGPYMFYCCSTYTEAMFIMFIVLFFYCCQQKKYLLAGCMAAAASGTRIVGCILVFALIIELYLDFVGTKVTLNTMKVFVCKILSEPQYLTAILLCPLGTFLYMTFLRFFCGDAFAFMHVQIAWREDYYFPIFGVLWKACTGQIEPRYTYMGWFCIGTFIVYGYMLVRKYYAMAVFGIVSLLVPLTSHVMSTCRFTVGSFVFLVGIYDLLNRLGDKSKIMKWLCIVFLTGFEIYLLFQWYRSDCWLM